MSTIKKLLESDNRGTEGYKIIDEKTIVINNSRSWDKWPETEQFINIIERNWGRDDIIKSVASYPTDEEKFYDACIIRFNVSINEEIEEFKAF